MNDYGEGITIFQADVCRANQAGPGERALGIRVSSTDATTLNAWLVPCDTLADNLHLC